MRKPVFLLALTALAMGFGAADASAAEVSMVQAQKICGKRWRVDANGVRGCFWSSPKISTSVACRGALPRCTVAVSRRVPRESGAGRLEGKPLRYLIGTDVSGLGHDGEITEVSYSATTPTAYGVSIKYCNLFDEENTGQYGPYLHTSDTAAEYNEGQIDPAGPGWMRNLQDQYERAAAQGFEYIELDNADAYQIEHVLGAIEAAKNSGLKVIAKNPLLLKDGAMLYVAHPNVFGVIVERGAGGPADMHLLREEAGKPKLPVWFVAFGKGRAWADNVADTARQFRNMGVTYSSKGEYRNFIHLLRPDGDPS